MNNNPTLFDTPEDDILTEVRVFFCGKFTEPVPVLADRMESRGAIVRSIAKSSPQLLGLSRETCVIVKGENPKASDLEKMQALDFDGYHIPVISETGLTNILNGTTKADFPKPVKKVSLTYDSIFKSGRTRIIHFDFFELTHRLGQKEIFLYNAPGNNFLLEQALGNIGAYSTSAFYPYETDYCWLTQETISKLKNGEKDEFIRIIEDTYNSSDSIKFTYKFIIGSEALYWMEYRARECGDDLSLDYITRYKESIYKQ